MIMGIGVDVVEVASLERRLERGSLRRVFSEAELAYADHIPGRRTEMLAARWAAKEAFAKALGTGLRAEWRLEEIEVVNDAHGKPSLRLGPSLRHLTPPNAVIHLSLSHTAAYATAFVVIETL